MANSQAHTENSAISVREIKKTFRLPHENHSGLKQIILGIFKKDRKKGYETQEVLKGVSFDVNKGDFFGIVGRNGSGKSTLLKLLAGIYTPDSGAITVNGSIVPFIELGVGFNPELTGRENIFMNGALLGFSHAEMEAMYGEIVEFAELERFMDQKLKNYSSGMQVRLAFSIAIKAQGDILILDEVLAVGDEAFQRKCNDFFDKIKKDKSKTVILVTHGMDSVRKYCNKAMMIRNGEVVAIGSPDDVANEYSLENFKKKEDEKAKEQEDNFVREFRVDTVSKEVLEPGDVFEATLSYEIADDVETNFGISIVDSDSNYILVNDGQDVERMNVEGAVSRTFKYRWTIPDISHKKLAMIATLNRVDQGERTRVAFIGIDKGANFLVTNNTTSASNRALFAGRGEWTSQ